MMLTLSARAAGRRRPLVPDWQIPWPPDDASAGEPLTLRQLITRIVQHEVAAFRQRQEERKLVRILTDKEIAAGLEKGRVDPGGRDLGQVVDADAAVATALQAFEDGLYLVFLDEVEQRELDRQVYVRPDSRLVFVRLVLLAGG